MSGKSSEIDKPIFTKPFVDKTADMIELVRGLEHAPEESRTLFQGAIASLDAQINMHRNVEEKLAGCGLPILVLYDIHIYSKAGSTAIDFVVLSNRFLLTISCPAQADLVTPSESRATALPGVPRHFSSSEHSAHILTELVKSDRLLSKKDLQMIWPFTVTADPENESHFFEPVESFPTPYSLAYPGIRREQNVHIDRLIDQMRQLFQFDKGASWLTNRELFAISDMLIKYDESASCGSNGQEGTQHEE